MRKVMRMTLLSQIKLMVKEMSQSAHQRIHDEEGDQFEDWPIVQTTQLISETLR